MQVPNNEGTLNTRTTQTSTPQPSIAGTVLALVCYKAMAALYRGWAQKVVSVPQAVEEELLIFVARARPRVPPRAHWRHNGRVAEKEVLEARAARVAGQVKQVPSVR